VQVVVIKYEVNFPRTWLQNIKDEYLHTLSRPSRRWADVIDIGRE